MFVRGAMDVWSQRAYVVVGATREDSSAMGVGGDQSDNTFAIASAVYIC